MDHSTERAFLEAFDAHTDALFRHALLRLPRREQAVDLTQDTFLKAWDYVRDGGEVRHWKSFLYRVLHNLIVDEYRKMRESSLDELLEEEVAAPLLATSSRKEREDELNDILLIERVREFIAELPDGQRAVVSLRYIDGFSPKEIAALLDLSENVVSVRIHRAITELKRRCEPLQNYE